MASKGRGKKGGKRQSDRERERENDPAVHEISFFLKNREGWKERKLDTMPLLTPSPCQPFFVLLLLLLLMLLVMLMLVLSLPLADSSWRRARRWCTS